ncbi:hypothetical protein Tco_0246684 [Tanacetum coccineum]
MRTRSQSRNSNRQQQLVPPTFVEPFDLVEPIDNQAPTVVMMADNRTMAQLLEAPTEGYKDAIYGNEETEVTKDTVPPTNNGSTKDVQPPVVQVETHVPNFEPVVAPVSAQKPNQKPPILYPSSLNDQKIREKANNQIEKFYQIFQDLHFDISFADAVNPHA